MDQYCLTCKVAFSLGTHGGHRVKRVPSDRVLRRYVDVALTPDGCRTEPDGDCPHGYPSWLIVAGVI
jgi:hypothetical protein